MESLKLLKFNNLPLGKSYKIQTERSVFFIARLGVANFTTWDNGEEEVETYPVLQFSHFINQNRQPVQIGMVAPASGRMFIERKKKMDFQLIEVDQSRSNGVFHLKFENLLKNRGRKVVFCPDLSGSPFFYDRKIVSCIVPSGSVELANNDGKMESMEEEPDDRKRRKGKNRGKAGKRYKRNSRRR